MDTPQMIVFTARGDEYRLREGATVLEFARLVHESFVAHVRSASVGKKHLGPLDPLPAETRVILNLDPDSRPLPVGYRSAIPDAKAVTDIEEAFRRSYRPRLERLGRRALTRRLLESGLTLGLDRVEIGETMEEAAKREVELLNGLVRSTLSSPEPSLSSIFCELALVEGRDVEMPFPRNFGDQWVEELLRKVYTAAVAFELGSRSDYASAPAVELCSRCFFGEMGPAWIESSPGKGGAVCHAPKSRCRPVRLRAGRLELTAPKPARVHVRARERRGVAAEIAAAMGPTGVGLNELLARVVGGEALVRLEIDAASEITIHEVKTVLRGIPGVEEVYGPRDEVPGDILVNLRAGRMRVQPQELSPYDVGVLIRSARRLYGRDEPLQKLLTWLGGALRAEGGLRQCMWIRGPFKYGKSSLVETAFEERRRQDLRTVAVRLDATGEESWRTYSHRLAYALLEAASSPDEAVLTTTSLDAPPIDASLSPNEPYPVSRLVNAIIRRLRVPVVVAVDEAIGLLAGTTEDGAASADMVRCFRDLMTTPKAALVLIAPKALWRLKNQEQIKLLSEMETIDLPPLDRTATFDLVRNAKSGRPLYIKELLLRKIYAETLGHPYWTQHVANEVWKLAHASRERVAYTPDKVNKALETLAKERLAFAQHLNYVNRYFPRDVPASKELRRLVDSRATQASQETPVFVFTRDALHTASEANTESLRMAEALIEGMQVIGIAVAHARKKHDRLSPTVGLDDRWQIPPVLLRHFEVYPSRLLLDPEGSA